MAYIYRPYVDSNGKGWGWGYNANYGGVGDNTTTNRSTPVAICGNHTFCQIWIGYYHSLGIDIRGKAWGWGSNTGGVGDNSTTARSTPVAVCGNHTFRFVVTSGPDNNISLGIDKNGKLWAWGKNQYGELGINNTTSKLTPVAVCGNHTFCYVHVSAYYSLGVDNNGKGWAWGRNNSGELGDNTKTARSTPVAICGGHTFSMIQGGDTHVNGIDNRGKAWGWGDNNSGAVGNNIDYLNYCTPVAVCGGHTFCLITVGRNNAAAIDNNGKAWAWGTNASGDLGNNAVTSQKTPVAVCGNHTFCAIYTHRAQWEMRTAIAIDYNGKAWSWGNNTYGNLGNKTATSISTPVAVCGNHVFYIANTLINYYNKIHIDELSKMFGIPLSGVIKIDGIIL